MGVRKKVTLALIANNSERKASYKKRKKGLMKKVSELSTLCGVDACVIIYSEYDPEPAVWPSTDDAKAVLARFRSLLPNQQTNKMVNQLTFTRQRIRKVVEKLRRVVTESKRLELEIFMYQCLAGLASMDFFDLQYTAEMRWIMNHLLREINNRMEEDTARGAGASSAELPETVSIAPPALPPMTPLPMPGENFTDGSPWDILGSPGLRWDDGMLMTYENMFNYGGPAV